MMISHFVFGYLEKCSYFIYKEIQRGDLRPPCGVIDDVITMKILFLHNLGQSFHTWGQMKVCLIFYNLKNWPPF